MKKKYIVRLSSEEREELTALVKTGKVAAYKRLNAQVLLKADIGNEGPGWPDAKIATTLDVSIRTVERLRERLCKSGLERALVRAKGGGRRRKLDGRQEAQLVALACSEAPEGRARWTLRLLADRLVALDYVDQISYEAVRQVLKKKCNKTVAKNGMVYSTKEKR